MDTEAKAILQFGQSADSQPMIDWKNFAVDKINQARFVFIVTARASRLKPYLLADQHVGRLSVLM